LRRFSPSCCPLRSSTELPEGRQGRRVHWTTSCLCPHRCFVPFRVRPPSLSLPSSQLSVEFALFETAADCADKDEPAAWRCQGVSKRGVVSVCVCVCVCVFYATVCCSAFPCTDSGRRGGRGTQAARKRRGRGRAGQGTQTGEGEGKQHRDGDRDRGGETQGQRTRDVRWCMLTWCARRLGQD
jgi:hypothetical protein